MGGGYDMEQGAARHGNVSKSGRANGRNGWLTGRAWDLIFQPFEQRTPEKETGLLWVLHRIKIRQGMYFFVLAIIALRQRGCLGSKWAMGCLGNMG